MLLKRQTIREVISPANEKLNRISKNIYIILLRGIIESYSY